MEIFVSPYGVTGVTNGDLERVLIELRGEDPRPDCPVLFVESNQVS